MKRSKPICWLRAWCIASVLSVLMTLGVPARIQTPAFAEEIEQSSGDAEAALGETSSPETDDEAVVEPATSMGEEVPSDARENDLPAALPLDGSEAAEGNAGDSDGGDSTDPVIGGAESTQVDSGVSPEIPREDIPAQDDSAVDLTAAQASDLPTAPKGAVEMDERTYVFQSLVTSNRVAQADGAKPKAGANVATAGYTGDVNQQWFAKREEDSLWYRLYVNAADGFTKVLVASTNGSEVVNVGVAKESKAEKKDLLSILWAFVSVDGTTYRIVNAAWDGMCLDVAGSKKAVGTNLALKKIGKKKAKNQRFRVLKRYPKVAAGSVDVAGAYLLKLDGSGLVAGVSGADKNGTNVTAMAKSGSSVQKVFLERNAAGYYTVWFVGTGKVLASANGSILPGGRICQSKYKGYARQQWAVTEQVNEDGSVSYRLQNRKTGLYLGAGSLAAGTNLAGMCDGQAHQGFELVHQGLMDKGIYLIHPTATAKLAVQVYKSSVGTARLVLANHSGALSQKFELVAVEGGEDLWRVRTGSSGGWITWKSGSKVVQTGSGATDITTRNTWRTLWINGGVVLVNVASEEAGTPLALDTSNGKTKKGTKLVVRSSTGSATQRFVFVATQLLSEGYYFLKSAGGKCVQVEGTSAAEKANIQVGSRKGTMGQLFKVEYKKGYTRIYNIYSKKYLQAEGKTAGSSVIQRKAGKSKLQRWTSVIMDGGKVSFVNAANKSLVLTAASHGKKKGADVKVETKRQDNGQLWQPVTLSDYVNTPKTKLEKEVVKWAKLTDSPGRGLCAAWVSYVFMNAGIGMWGGDACDQYWNWCKNADFTKLRPGMIIAVSSHGHTAAGSIWGHVGIYVGNGMVMDNIGWIRKISLFEWVSWYGDRVTPKWGWIGKRKLA